MQMKSDTLSAVVENLAEALEDVGYGPRIWAARVDLALSAVEQGIGQRYSALDHPHRDGFGAEDEFPYPGMNRHRGRHDDLTGLLAEVTALRDRLHRLLEGLPEDEAGLRRRGAALLDALERYEREETWLTFEAATTDIGGGD
jgi:hypothetical protein